MTSKNRKSLKDFQDLKEGKEHRKNFNFNKNKNLLRKPLTIMHPSGAKRKSNEFLTEEVQINNVDNLSNYNFFNNLPNIIEEEKGKDIANSRNSTNTYAEAGSDDEKNERIIERIPKMKFPRTANDNSSKNTGRFPDKSITEEEIQVIKINNPLNDYHRKARALVSTANPETKSIKTIKKMNFFKNPPMTSNSKSSKCFENQNIIKQQAKNLRKYNNIKIQQNSFNLTNFSKVKASTDFINSKENKKYQSLQNSQMPGESLRTYRSNNAPNSFEHKQRKLNIMKETVDKNPQDKTMKKIKSIKSCKLIPQKIIIPGKTIHSKIMPGLFLGFSKNYSEMDSNSQKEKFSRLANNFQNSQFNSISSRYHPNRKFDEYNQNIYVIENPNEYEALQEFTKGDEPFINSVSNFHLEGGSKYLFYQTKDYNNNPQGPQFIRKLKKNEKYQFSDLFSNSNQKSNRRGQSNYLDHLR